jgi:hypothetical protein
MNILYKLAKELAIRRIFKDTYADKIISGEQLLHPREWNVIEECASEIMFEDLRPKKD